MHFRKVICLGGLIALTGCCHTVPTNEFVDPRFNLTLLPYSKTSRMTTLRPNLITTFNAKETITKETCVLVENEIGFVRLQCRWVDHMVCGNNCPLTDISYRVVDDLYLRPGEVGKKNVLQSVLRNLSAKHGITFPKNQWTCYGIRRLHAL